MVPGRVLTGAEVVAAALALALPAPAAAAENVLPEQQPIRVQYEAPPSCPDALAFFLAVRARTQRVRLAESGELAALVAVRIREDGGRTQGTLELPGTDGTPFVRQVDATSCGEVVLALSLVLALAYDPDAITMFPAEEPPPAAPPQPAVQPPPPPPVAPAPSKSPLSVATGALAFFMNGFEPDARPMFAAFIEAGGSGDALWTPRVAAALFGTYSNEVVVNAEQSATFWLLGGRLTACPLRLAFASQLSASPCVALDVAQIFARGGKGVDSPETRTAWWVSLAALASIRWEPASPFFVEAFGGGGGPFFPPRFVLEGGAVTVHEPGPFLEGGLGVGAHFP